MKVSHGRGRKKKLLLQTDDRAADTAEIFQTELNWVTQSTAADGTVNVLNYRPH